MTEQPGRLMLLDTASMYFRAFFGVPEITAPDGTTPVNAVRGLLDFIARLVDEYQPTDLVCCWDNDWRPQWRVDLVPTYKAHRVVAEVADRTRRRGGAGPARGAGADHPRGRSTAFGIGVVGADGYEADDVIGTLATGAGQPVDIVTGDRDLFQLVDDEADVRVLYIARGVGQPRAGRPTTGCAPSTASTPRQYADFATLRGDASDGLPGVPGVGEKTAATLLGALRRHGRHHRRGRRTRTPTWGPGPRARSRPRPTTSRWPRRSSPCAATSTWTGPARAAPLPARPDELPAGLPLGAGEPGAASSTRS